MEKEYCMECLKENPPEREICECGGRNFTWGDDISIVDKKVTCKCGSNTFEKSFHIDFVDFSNTTYVCSACGNAVGVQIHRELG